MKSPELLTHKLLFTLIDIFNNKPITLTFISNYFKEENTLNVNLCPSLTSY